MHRFGSDNQREFPMRYKGFIAAILLVVFCTAANAQDNVYKFHGPWKTTNRRLDGVQTAEVTRLAAEEWKMRVYGTWQGVDYDYTVKFSGPPDKLRGTAQIDGADYEWTGFINQARFKGSFTGSRYTGSFEMLRVEKNGI